MKYTIRYDYNSWTLGCECCTDCSSEITIFNGGTLIKLIEHSDLMENAEELTQYINENHPEYSSFTIDPDSTWW
jgi:hypothetical protein